MSESIWQKLTGLSRFELEEEEEEEVRGRGYEVRKEEERGEEKKRDEREEKGRKEEKGEKGEKRGKREEKEIEKEGKLAVDVYENPDQFIVWATLAGAEPEDIDIAVNLDMLSIRGKRIIKEDDQGKYLNQECCWGEFSRTIILPAEVNTRKTQATLKNGILTITLPKLKVRTKKMQR